VGSRDFARVTSALRYRKVTDGDGVLCYWLSEPLGYGDIR
jgi:hypothetical protein